ncbi:MAG: hypothetical protein IBJ10_05425 [Phycisphaerales bacterium]|nr:hypothetical protein [Phycisphaerales bacterium]
MTDEPKSYWKYFGACYRLVSDSLSLAELEALSGVEHESVIRWSVGDPNPIRTGELIERTRLVVGSEADDFDPPIEHLRSILEQFPEAWRMQALADAGVQLEIDFFVRSNTFTTSLEMPIDELIAALRDCPMRVQFGCSYYPGDPIGDS